VVAETCIIHSEARRSAALGFCGRPVSQPTTLRASCSPQSHAAANRTFSENLSTSSRNKNVAPDGGSTSYRPRYVRITLDGLDCRWSGLVVSFLNSTTGTRPDQTHGPLGSSTSPPSGRRLVRSVSTCTNFVWLDRRQSPWVRVVEFRNDATTPDQRATKSGRSGPCQIPLHGPDRIADPTRRSPLTCRRLARTQRTWSETRVGRQSVVGPA